MKRLLLASAVVLAVTPLSTIAQPAPPPADSTRAATQTKGVHLSGKVSVDGKTLLTDDENVWAVSNAQALKGFENLYVTVQCRMDPANRAIRVLLVIDPPAAQNSRISDAAFRR